LPGPGATKRVNLEMTGYNSDGSSENFTFSDGKIVNYSSSQSKK